MTLEYTGTTLPSHYKCNWLVLTQAFFPWPNPSKRNQTATFFTALSTWRQRSCSWSSLTSHMFWFRVITAFVMSLWMTQMLRCVDVLGINRYIIEKETCNARHISPPFPPTTQSSVVGAGGGYRRTCNKRGRGGYQITKKGEVIQRLNIKLAFVWVLRWDGLTTSHRSTLN